MKPVVAFAVLAAAVWAPGLSAQGTANNSEDAFAAVQAAAVKAQQVFTGSTRDAARAAEREEEAAERAREREEEAREREQEAQERAKERAEQAKERDQEARERAKERELEARERAKERAQEAKEREQERAERDRERAEEAVERAQERAERAYERASEALDRRRWDTAVKHFAEVARDSGRADGAAYWTAYAQYKAGRRAEALASVARMLKEFPQSRWLSDARALEIEIRQAQGQPVRPESEEDEELKLMAINSVMHADPERGIPMLEKVLTSAASPQLKERALFVLLQSGSPKARQVAANLALGKGNPDLQLKAISQLGLFGGKEAGETLAQIYRGSQDPAIRRQVIQAWFLAGNSAKMGELARTEKDPDVRVEAIQKLGLMGKRTSADLSAIYAADSDTRVRRAVLNAFFLQSNAPALIEVARKETNPQLKKEAVSKLSLMNSKEATEFMMEILNK